MQDNDWNEYEPAAPSAPISPNNPPWGSIEALGIWIVSVLCIVIVPAVFFFVYLAAKQIPLTDTTQVIETAKSDPTAVLLQIAAILPAHLVTLLLAWLVITRFRKYSFWKTLGFERGGFRWWHYCIILGGFFIIAFGVGSLLPEQENELIRILRSSRAAVYVVALIATFTAPLVEEVVYRGVLYSAFQRSLGVPAAFVAVTFLFALVHVPQYYPSFSTIFLLTLLSVILTFIRVKSDNLLPCVILHTIFNGFQSVLLIIEPLLTKPADLQAALTGPS